MESLATLHHCRHPLPFSLSHLPSSLSRPISSVSFRSLPPRLSPSRFSSSSFRSPSIRAASLPSESFTDSAFLRRGTTLPQLLQTLNSLFSPVIRTTCTILAAAVFFYMRLRYKPAIAAPLEMPTVESSTESTENSSNEENQRVIGERLSNNPNDTEALRSLIEVKVRARKIEEAIQVIDRLIELEPEEFEWPLLKAHMYVYNGDCELAREKFEEILTKDPYRVEAYHGLVMATSESDKPLEDLLKRIEEAVEFCKKQKRESDVRDLRLLIAQIKVMEGEFSDALKAYQELVKEEPKDFRPYLCLGIIYTLLRKKDEAEKQFDKFRRLIPKNHPYREYFEDNMFEMNVISQKAERAGVGAKN
ncbi:protein SLOW GREEN 1, chloroplastic-like [Neltuma alba]|uniref:protein SLOW GREEN 1, chloroplastic-like n=1 Tax=Neltuma alba TaxID=207710 RepID=UPI0010A5A067|nr:protein SLOW GREEN 1, chloroplastic-like [Prosopis alba]